MNLDNAKLNERFQRLIEILSSGSQTGFAQKAGISQTTLNRNLKEKDDRLLLNLVGSVLLAFPEVNHRWLLTGQGEMLCSNTTSVDTTARLAEMEERIRELKYTVEVQKQLLEKQADEPAPPAGEANIRAPGARGEG